MLQLRTLEIQIVRVAQHTSVRTHTAELLQWDHGFVKPLVIIHHNLLIAALAYHQTGVTPTEFVHAPE